MEYTAINEINEEPVLPTTPIKRSRSEQYNKLLIRLGGDKYLFGGLFQVITIVVMQANLLFGQVYLTSIAFLELQPIYECKVSDTWVACTADQWC